MTYHKVIGIDLGTTYSAVSLWDNEKQELRTTHFTLSEKISNSLAKAVDETTMSSSTMPLLLPCPEKWTIVGFSFKIASCNPSVVTACLEMKIMFSRSFDFSKPFSISRISSSILNQAVLLGLAARNKILIFNSSVTFFNSFNSLEISGIKGNN